MLTVAGSVFAQATTKSKAITAKKTAVKKTEGSLLVSQKSILDRISLSYYGEITKGDITEEADHSPDFELYNSIGVAYEITEAMRFDLSLRWVNSDAFDAETGKTATYTSLDPRLSVSYRTNAFVNKYKVLVEAPTTDASQDEDKITRLRLYAYMTGKQIDDFNTVGSVVFFERDFYSSDPTPGEDDTRNYRLYQGFNWVNTALSENYRPKLELELIQTNPEDKDPLHIEFNAATRLLAGVDMTILGASVFPYLIHSPSKPKAADQLGAGMQFYKAF